MAAAWPPGFPSPLREGFGYSSPELNLRTEFAFGSRVRPLYTDGPDSFRATVLLNAPQWAYLQAWHRYVLANGAGWFLMPLIASGVLETREVRLTGPLSYELIGHRSVRVSLLVETRAGTALSAEVFESFAAFPDPESAWLDLQALENFVNG